MQGDPSLQKAFSFSQTSIVKRIYQRFQFEPLFLLSLRHYSEGVEVLDTLPQQGGTAVTDRTTTPYMTKYERARVMGTRALQISMNAPVLVQLEVSRRCSRLNTTASLCVV